MEHFDIQTKLELLERKIDALSCWFPDPLAACKSEFRSDADVFYPGVHAAVLELASGMSGMSELRSDADVFNPRSDADVSEAPISNHLDA